MHCLVPGSYFVRNTCGVQDFKQPLKTFIFVMRQKEGEREQVHIRAEL